MEIAEYESVKYWLKSMGARAEGTKVGYVSHLKRFCQWLNKSPDQLIAEREEHLKSTDKKVKRTMELNVKEYNAFLDNQGKGAGTKMTARAAIRSFFEHHYLPLEFIRGDFPSEAMAERRKVEKEEIIKMLEEADVRGRGIIHVLKDTGLAVSDVSRLKLRDLLPPTKISPLTSNDIENLPEFIPLKMTRKKTKAKIQTFLGPEAIKALKNYLNRRIRGTAQTYPGRSKKGFPPEVLTLDSPLFRTSAHEIKRMSTKRILDNVREIASRAGIPDISAHCFRKYTQTMLEVARIDPNWRKLILGKKLPGSEGSYSLPSMGDLQKAYEGAYEHIAIEIPKISEEDRRIQSIIDNARLLGISDNVIHDLLKERGKTWHKPSELTMRMAAYRKKTEPNGGSTDCDMEYKEVNENDLLMHLRVGWKIVHNLQNGRVIISKG